MSLALLAWLVLQLVFWAGAMAVTVIGALAVFAAPPYFAGRYVWQRLR